MKVSKKIVFTIIIFLSLFSFFLAAEEITAKDPPPIPLPPPQTEGGKPLMQALKLRATCRAFSSQPLPLQTVSNLLWAAWGVNRTQEKKRTAPSTMNWQEIDLFLLMEKGIYLYDAFSHVLEPVAAGDRRDLAGVQEFAKEAPLTLIFVANLAVMGDGPAERKTAFAWADASFIGQNVHLFCASEGLGTGVRARVDREELAKALKLDENQSVVFAMSVGFPKKP